MINFWSHVNGVSICEAAGWGMGLLNGSIVLLIRDSACGRCPKTRFAWGSAMKNSMLLTRRRPSLRASENEL